MLHRLCAVAVVIAAAWPAVAAHAVVAPPVTLDGPGTDVLDLGGVAIAPDGTGGIVYTEALNGTPHVFARRYVRGHWYQPIRVDSDRPYDASWPRIAADDGGRLLVVWVTQMATVHNRIQRGLVSAALGPGASAFGPSLVVDPNVGNGGGVSPVLSRTSSGQAIVAYRVVTNDFTDFSAANSTAVQLRPGDVMADVRVARLAGPTWSRVGAINRNPAASMRPPDATNGPQIAASPDGNSIVAWQEPDQSGAARVWVRRIFGTVPGPVLEASPTSWNGRPVTDDADALAIDATQFGMGRVAMRVDGSPGGALGGQRLFLNTLPSTLDTDAAKLTGVVPVDGGGPSAPAGGVGAPSVSAEDSDGADGALWLAFAQGRMLHLTTADENGALVARPSAGPPVAPDGAVVSAVNPSGGGIAAWDALDPGGRPGVGVREDFPSGAIQTAFVAGAQSGPVSELSIGRAATGDAIVAFRQGDAGHFEIVADRVTVPPAGFELNAPADWVAPRRARLSWSPASSAVGGVTYTVLLDGQPIARHLRRRSLTPSPSRLGSGIRQVRVIATDALGQQLLSAPLGLHVDARPPTVSVRARRLTVVVRVRDRQSGVVAAATTCSFGDRSRPLRRHATCRHAYRRAGVYRIVVRSRDVVGNRGIRRLPVQVR